jgi:acid phosphatase (class A)
VLRWLQHNRTPEQVANAWVLLDRNLALFSRALGLDLTKSAPGLLRGLRPFLAEVDGASSQLKRQARRPRPYASHPELKPCLPPETGYSFPSGHATWYAAAAELLAALVPERRERLLQVGSHGGASRVMCGVHYPSDVEAGRRLGVAAAAQIQRTAAWRSFRDDPSLQGELQQIRSLPVGSLPELVR